MVAATRDSQWQTTKCKQLDGQVWQSLCNRFNRLDRQFNRRAERFHTQVYENLRCLLIVDIEERPTNEGFTRAFMNTRNIVSFDQLAIC